MPNNNSNKTNEKSIPRNTSSKKSRICLQGLNIKEDGEDIVITGLAATTHPDRVGDILSENAIQQIVDHINDTSTAGDDSGAFRSVSLFHDWVIEGDPTKDEVAFTKPTARKVQLPDGHYGAEVDTVLNKYYRGDMTLDEVKYRIDNKQIAGFSIEYDTDNDNTKEVQYQGETYNFINKFSQFGGLGLARARKIANPHAVIYKEIEDKFNVKEELNMAEKDKDKKEPVDKPAEDEKAKPKTEAELEAEKKEKAKKEAEKKPTEKTETKETNDEKVELDIKEIVKQVTENALKELEVKSKVVKTTKEKEEIKMKEQETPLSIKEMKDSISDKGIDTMRFKEAASTYFAENPNIDMQLKGIGIPLKTTMTVKCEGTKLRILNGLKIKATLDTTTNAGAYTESIVEFADLFIPGLVETFNNQANLFGALKKVNHLMGGGYYGWRIKTDQASTLSVDPDDPSITFDPVDKLKLRTDIKEYRIGVSVTDYVLHHARATMGDLLLLEAEARMGDLMRDINNDLFTEQVDTAGNKILGLEAVADATGNTEMYGKTRSTANRLAPATATDTYTEVGGALTTAYLRLATRSVEKEGALRANLRYVCDPVQRDALFELEDGNQRYQLQPRLGFEGKISYDGVEVIVDSSCQTDAFFVIDMESYYIVMSRAPQMIGLAKVGAAESAYISVYLAAVYEQPRRIYMLNTLT